MVTLNHVTGKNKGKIILYALSTCAMCKGVKRILNELGVEYDYIDVDLLDPPDKEEVRNKMHRWNSRSLFPMLVIDDKRCIIGDEPDQIKEVLAP